MTKPCLGMRRAMAEAIVGDDVFGDDPTVIELQNTVAKLLNKEAGLFVPTGKGYKQWYARGHTKITIKTIIISKPCFSCNRYYGKFDLRDEPLLGSRLRSYSRR